MVWHFFKYEYDSGWEAIRLICNQLVNCYFSFEEKEGTRKRAASLAAPAL